MSDYIKRSGLAEKVIDAFCGDCIECGEHCRHDDLVEIIEHLPTLDEKEIIRKAFERVVERLENIEPTPWEIVKIVKEECGINE